jgi:hypothetical protein
MDILKDALIKYYNMSYNYNLVFKEKNNIKFEDSTSDFSRSKVIINNIPYEYQTLGRFDESTNFWEWGWSFETIKNRIYDTREIFLYAINIHEEENKILKNILLNARIKNKNDINIEFILGLSLLYLSTFNYNLIYKVTESDTISKYIILRKK